MVQSKAQKKILGLLRGTYNEFRTRDAIPLLIIISPVIFLMIIDSASFSLIWFWGGQIGRAGFAFLFFLVAWDFHDSRNKLKATKAKWRYALTGVALAVLLIYYWERVMNADWTTYLRVYVTSQLGVSQKSPLSFLLAMDFVVFAIYCAIATALLYTPRAVALIVTPIIYAAGSGILDMMDAYFPEDSLAFLQVWVYVIWNVVVFLLSLLGFHTNVNPLAGTVQPPSIQLIGNRLLLWGSKGFITLAIFWPSSGVVSMIVYSLVIVVLMVKLEAPRKRKAIYAVIGAAGTYFVNVIRITLIVLYVAFISLDVEAFHQSIGEVLFITWIFIYLLFVIRTENKYYRKTTTPPPGADSVRPSLHSLRVNKTKGRVKRQKRNEVRSE
jgi:thaumarchaeosortase